MIKKYYITSDKKTADKKYYVFMDIQKKINKILSGKKELIEKNDFFEIWKVLSSYDLKLVLILKEKKDCYLIIESIAISSAKEELEKMQIEFNTCLKEEEIDFIRVKDKNNY